MAEPKPFASLSSGLLARKGAARPAMRPQGFGQSNGNLDDLGWNDMGNDESNPEVVAGAALHPRGPSLGLSPVNSPVHGQQAEIASRYAEEMGEEYDDTAVPYDPEGTLGPVEAEDEDYENEEDFDEEPFATALTSGEATAAFDGAPPEARAPKKMLDLGPAPAGIDQDESGAPEEFEPVEEPVAERPATEVDVSRIEALMAADDYSEDYNADGEDEIAEEEEASVSGGSYAQLSVGSASQANAHDVIKPKLPSAFEPFAKPAPEYSEAPLPTRERSDNAPLEDYEDDALELDASAVVAPSPDIVAASAPAVVSVAPNVTANKPARAAKPRAGTAGKGKAAFTLRLEQDRHLKLRLACAVQGISAQMLVTQALDQLLADMPELDALAEKASRKG